MRLSFRARLTMLMTGLISLTLTSVGLYAFVSSQNSIADLSGRIIAQTSTLVDERIGSLLGSAEDHSRVLAGLGQSVLTDPDALGDPSEVQSLARTIFSIIEVNPDFGSISIISADDGEYLQAFQSESGAVILQTSILTPAGRRTGVDYRKYGNEFEAVLTHINWDYDPREEPFYSRAVEAQRQIWTDYRQLESFGGDVTMGITCVTPFYDPGGELLGVVTVDFTTAGLSRFLDRIEVGDSGRAFLVELAPAYDPKIIAHPDSQSLVVQDDGQVRLATLAEFEDAPARTLVERYLANIEALTPSDTRPFTFSLDGTRYIAGYKPVSRPNAPRWVMGIVVPYADFFGPLRQAAAATALIGLAVLIIGIGLSLWMSRRVAMPLKELVDETRRIRGLDLAPRDLPHSNIREVEQLSSAMEQMKTGLRSFEKLVPKQYAQWLLSSGQEARLGGERRRLTIYFADIIGFTSLSEQMPPEKLVEVLAEYLEALSEVVLENGGTIDKYNGDDVMAFWGAPDPHQNSAIAACQSALDSDSRLRRLHQEWADSVPRLEASFGIATGEVVVGNVGSRSRMNYTVIGDAANLASRLQGLNKVYHTRALIDEETASLCRERMLVRPVDWVGVVGKAQPAKIFELLGELHETADGDREAVRIYSEGMALYRLRSWDEAIAKFDRCLELRPDDGPARVLRRRCERYRDREPSSDWDGAIYFGMKH